MPSPQIHVFILDIVNDLQVIGCVSQPPHLIVVQQYLSVGSLYDILHGKQKTNVVVDSTHALRFALDIARGMAFLHSLDPMLPNYVLSTRHVMVSRPLRI